MTSGNLNTSRRTASRKHERNALYLKADGMCEICGQRLGPDWEADHVAPFSETGRTNIHELQATCRRCNRAKGASLETEKCATDFFHSQQLQQFRPFQRDFADCLAKSAVTAVNKYVLADACTGSGKSVLPAIALKIARERNIADKLCVVCPTSPLQQQMAEDFLNHDLREMVGHSFEINESCNEVDPCRGLDGFVTTYQALGLDSSGVNAAEFERERYLLVLDEAHHVGRDTSWHHSLRPIVDNAALCVFMSGSLERGDKSPIAFLPYREAQS